MKDRYEVIVMGVGTMGSAVCHEVARRGGRVLGLDQFAPPHEHGSHTGQSRIIRKAYFEHPDYVPLLERAYEGWRSLEKSTGDQIYHQTGIIYLGKPDNTNLAGVKRAAQLHGIKLITSETRDLNPAQFSAPDDFTVLHEPEAGFLQPEKAIRAFIAQAKHLGADIRTNEKVLDWKADGPGVTVVTSAGTYHAGKLVITAGIWTEKILKSLGITLTVTSQVLAWAIPKKIQLFQPDQFPCWFIEDPEYGMIYGFPYLSTERFPGPSGLKLAHHAPGTPTDPDAPVAIDVRGTETLLRQMMQKYMPSALHHFSDFKQCFYTYSPDSDFILDHVPGHFGSVVVGCGFSGHGFKFAPVIGEILADLALEGKTSLPARFLSLDRFKQKK